MASSASDPSLRTNASSERSNGRTAWTLSGVAIRARLVSTASRTRKFFSLAKALARAGTLPGSAAAARAADQRSSSVPRASAASTAAGSVAGAAELNGPDGGLRTSGMLRRDLEQTGGDFLNGLYPVGTFGPYELAWHPPHHGGLLSLC